MLRGVMAGRTIDDAWKIDTDEPTEQRRTTGETTA